MTAALDAQLRQNTLSDLYSGCKQSVLTRYIQKAIAPGQFHLNV